MDRKRLIMSSPILLDYINWKKDIKVNINNNKLSIIVNIESDKSYAIVHYRTVILVKDKEIPPNFDTRGIEHTINFNDVYEIFKEQEQLNSLSNSLEVLEKMNFEGINITNIQNAYHEIFKEQENKINNLREKIWENIIIDAMFS